MDEAAHRFCLQKVVWVKGERKDLDGISECHDQTVAGKALHRCHNFGQRDGREMDQLADIRRNELWQKQAREDGLKEGIAEGIKEGEKKAFETMARDLLSDGMPAEKV